MIRRLVADIQDDSALIVILVFLLHSWSSRKKDRGGDQDYGKGESSGKIMERDMYPFVVCVAIGKEDGRPRTQTGGIPADSPPF